MKRLTVLDNRHVRKPRHLARGVLLVVVSVLTKLCPPRHQDQWLSDFGGRQDCAHPGMRHDKAGGVETLAERCLRQMSNGLDETEAPPGWAALINRKRFRYYRSWKSVANFA